MLPEEFPSKLELSVHQGLAGLAALRADWERLEANLPARRFFHLYKWYLSYLATLAETPENTRFFALRRGGAVVAIFPLQSLTRNVHGVRLRTLQIPLHPHVNLTDFVFDKTNDSAGALFGRLLIHLREQKDIPWDVLIIPRALEDSAAMFALGHKQSGRQICAPRQPSDYLTCREGYKEIDAKMTSSFRRNLRRLKRRAEAMGKLEYRSSREPLELEPLFELFMEAEASGWKGEAGEGSAIRCQPQVQAFYRSLIDQYSANNACVINILLLNGKCVAGQFCLLINGILYILKIGYDETHAQIAPGYLLLDHVLRNYADENLVHGVNFVTNPPWSHLWRARSLAVYECTLYNNTARGWLAYLWAKGKLVVRALTPSSSRKSEASHKNSPRPEEPAE